MSILETPSQMLHHCQKLILLTEELLLFLKPQLMTNFLSSGTKSSQVQNKHFRSLAHTVLL